MVAVKLFHVVVSAVRFVMPHGILRWWEQRAFVGFEPHRPRGPWLKCWRNDGCKLELYLGRLVLIIN